VSTELVYCADGNRRFAEIAIQHGYTYGARLPARGLAFGVEFADQEYRRPDRVAYMRELAEHKPRLATVLDLEHPEQFEEVLSWAMEAARYVSEAVIIIPKFGGTIAALPRYCDGIPVRLGYSVPTSYGGTMVDRAEFSGWGVHLLGGSPVEQIKLAGWLRVVSADTNYDQKISAWNMVFLNRDAHYYVRLNTLGMGHVKGDAMYQAFRLSRVNMLAAWAQCPAWLRPALPEHVEMVKRVANQYKDELGFVNRSALLESVGRGGLWVACVGQRVVGFVNYRTRRDGVSVIYEIATDRNWTRRGIGGVLLSAVPLPRRLKTTADNCRANEFYEGRGMMLVGIETGRKRVLNVWESR
jgi:GNAT superfamily N-acetyltransferase